MHARNNRPPFSQSASAAAPRHAGDRPTPAPDDKALSAVFRKALRAGGLPVHPSGSGHDTRELARMAKSDHVSKAPAAASNPKPSKVPGKGHR